MSIWDQNPRRIRIQVLINGADITPYIVGDVTIDRDGNKPIPTCDFTLFSPRMAFYAIGSVSNGPLPVQVYVLCRGGLLGPDEEKLEFDGVMEAPSNTGLYIPQGSIHAVAKTAQAAERPGCLLTNAFPEQTRYQLITTFSESALTGIGLLDGGIDSGTVTKPQDLQGITLLDLMTRWGNVDGWEIREEDGSLRCVRADEIAAPALTPKWEFTPSNYYHCAETPPARPITKWTISSSFTYLEPDDTVVVDTVDGSGTTRVTTTTVDGAITEIITERLEDYTPLGTTPQTPLTATVIERETITNTYATSSALPIAQLTDRVTVREAWYAPFSAAGTTPPDYTFTDGSFRRGATAETLQEVERTTETFTWDVIGCYLSGSTHEYKAWLARPVETSDDGTHTDAGTVWPDGETRIEAYEIYDVVKTITTAEDFLPSGGIVQPPYSTGYANSNYYHRFATRYQYLDETRSNPAWATTRATSRQERIWKENQDGTKHTLRETKWGIRAYYDTGSAGFYFEAVQTGPGASDVTNTINSSLPIPVTLSPTERQYSMVPVTATFESIGSFEPRSASETNDAFETAEEFDRWARWRLRKDFADRLTISHPYQPTEFFREWDPVRVTDSARHILDMAGWVEHIKFVFNPANGRADQVTTVAIDPKLAIVGGCA